MKQNKDFFKLLSFVRSCYESDLVYLRKKAKTTKDKDLKMARVLSLKKNGLFKRPLSADDENRVKSLNNLYYGEALKHNAEMRELNEDLPDLNCINEEDYKDDDGWF